MSASPLRARSKGIKAEVERKVKVSKLKIRPVTGRRIQAPQRTEAAAASHMRGAGRREVRRLPNRGWMTGAVDNHEVLV
jgi:hypothetical protein